MTKTVFFDYDGVIIDSFKNVFEVYKKICTQFNLYQPQDIEEFRRIYGYSYYECLDNLGASRQDFSRIKEMYKEEIHKTHSELFPGIKEVIYQLSENYNLFLVSASFSKDILSKFKKYELVEPFKEIFGAADHGMKKSEIMNNILKKYSYEPHEVVSIGDRNIDYDIAKHIGLKDDNIILTSYGWGFDRSKTGKAHIVDEPQEILDCIN